jgi:hypothetical protein
MLVWDDGKTITSSDVIYQCKVIERMYMYAAMYGAKGWSWGNVQLSKNDFKVNGRKN